MIFRHAAFFVPDVPRTVRFYEVAFGFDLRYLHPSSGYAELQTGVTLLSFIGERFAAEAQLLGDLPVQPNRPGSDPCAALVAFVTEHIERDWARAVAAGAVVVKAPEDKPWGQRAGYLRDPDGILIELATPSPRG